MAIHPTAIVDQQARVAPNAYVGPYCVLEGDVRLEDNVRLIAHIHAKGSLLLEPNVVVYPFSSLGADPDDLKHDGASTSATIGADTIIRERVIVCRGTKLDKGTTVVGRRCFVMAQSYIAHDCSIGDHCVLSMGTILAGHVRLGSNVRMGAGSVTHQFVRIGDYTMIGAGARVTRDVLPYALVQPSESRIAGLNLVGLRRRNFALTRIRRLQQAFALLADDAHPWVERVAAVEALTIDLAAEETPELRALVSFLREDSRRSFTAITL